jgi:hypothetical protein
MRLFLPSGIAISVRSSTGHSVEAVTLRDCLPLLLIAVAGVLSAVALSRAFIAAAHR